MAEFLQNVHKAIAETEPEKLESLSIPQLQTYRKFLLEAWPYVDRPLEIRCRDHVEAIGREIELRRIEEKAEKRHKTTQEKADQRHQASYNVEKWILIFAIAGVVIGMLTLGSEYFSLIRDTFFSKVQPASVPQSTPNSLYQKPTSIAESPEPEASSSTAKPSPEQTATTTPLLSMPTP